MSEISRRQLSKSIAAGSLATVVNWPGLLQADEQPAVEKRPPKSCILVWLEGAPSTFDMWDLKPHSKFGKSPFGQIDTAGKMRICEHLPRIAKVMDRLSIVRSMSSREAAHDRGAYFMQTGFVPNPTVVHPTAGSVISHARSERRKPKDVPGYVSIDGPQESGGYLGPQFAPLLIRSRASTVARVKPADDVADNPDAAELLKLLNDEFGSGRTERLEAFSLAREAARRFYGSEAAGVLNIEEEDAGTRAAYGDDEFGRAMLLARRLVERRVPFVRVKFPKSWDVQGPFFDTLRLDLLPTLDRPIAALVNDLSERMMLDRVVLLVMGSCGRSPMIRDGRREPWARTWSLLIGGGGLQSGIAVGETDENGTGLLTPAYSAPQLWATVLTALGVPPDPVHVDQNGRPQPILGGADPIRELIG